MRTTTLTGLLAGLAILVAGPANAAGLPKSLHGIWVPQGQSCPSSKQDVSPAVLRVQAEAYSRDGYFCLRDGRVKTGRTVSSKMICRIGGKPVRHTVSFQMQRGTTVSVREGTGRRLRYQRCSRTWTPSPADLARIRERGTNYVTSSLKTTLKVHNNGRTFEEKNTRFYKTHIHFNGVIDATEEIGTSKKTVRKTRSRIGEAILDDTGSQVIWFFDGDKLIRWRARHSYFQANTLKVTKTSLTCGGMNWVLKPGEKSYRTVMTRDRSTVTILKASWSGGGCTAQRSMDPFDLPRHQVIDISFKEGQRLKSTCKDTKAPKPTAIAACTKLISHTQGSTPASLASLYVLRGELYKKNGDSPRYLADIDRAIALTPMNERLHRMRAFHHRKAKRHRNAARDYKAALDVLKEKHRVYLTIPEMTKRAAKTKGKLANTYRDLILMHRRANRIDEAIAVADEWIAFAPGDYSPYSTKSVILAKTGNTSAVIQTWETYLAKAEKPRSTAFTQLGRQYRNNKAFGKAITAWDRALGRQETVGLRRITALTEKARDLGNLKRYDEAIASLSEAITSPLPKTKAIWASYKRKVEAARIEARFIRALAYLQIKQPKKAHADLNRVIAMRPNLPRPRVVRARILQMTGKPERAIEDIHVACTKGTRRIVQTLQTRTRRAKLYSGAPNGKCSATLKKALTKCMRDRRC